MNTKEKQETIADIVREMREGWPPAEPTAGDLTIYADRIEAAERKLSKIRPNNGPEIGQLAPKPDWGVHEALAFANTLANHGWTREANPDAASSCIYALCRHLRIPVNAAMREALTGRDMAAARGAINDLVSDCNAALSSATCEAKDIHIRVAKSAAKEAWSRLDNLIRAALAAPARNCDRRVELEV